MKVRFGRVSFGRDNDTIIELNTLEDLFEIVRKEEKATKRPIIVEDNSWDETDDIEFRVYIYDDYLE